MKVNYPNLPLNLSIKLSILLITSSLSMLNPAKASGPRVDYFGTSAAKINATNNASLPASKTNSIAMPKTSETIWFEQVDSLVDKYTPSEADKVILSRPFNQEAERVTQWIKTAKKIINNYHNLASQLKQITVPESNTELKEYISLTSEWYADSAQVFEDLIKPRKPANTIEELQEALDEIKSRSDNLSKTKSSLMSMDLSLRKTYNVHIAKQDDALQQYVNKK